MRKFVRLCGFAVVLLVMPTSPASAGETYFAEPAVDVRYNDGDVGFVHLEFGVPSGERRSSDIVRQSASDCQMLVEAQFGPGPITFDLVARAHALPYGTVRPAAVGVTCVFINGNGIRFEVAAAESGVAVAATRQYSVNYVSPVTVCSRPNVLWNDNVHEVAPFDYCVTG